MEEKKRRPRLIKPDSGFSLKERPKTDRPEKENASEENFDRNSPPNQEKPFERKPYDNDRPDNRDRNEGSTFERRPFNPDNNREGGGGFERKPLSREGDERRPYDNDRPRPFNPDRNRDSSGGGFERKPYNREGGDRKPYDNDRKPYDNDRPRPFNPDRNRDSSSGGGGYERKPYNREGGDRKPYDNDRPRPFNPDRNRDSSSGGGGYERKPYNREGGDRKPYDNDRPRPFNPDRSSSGGGGYERKPYNKEGGDRRPFNNDRPSYGDRSGGGDRKPYNNRGGGGGGFNKKPFGKKPFGRKDDFVIDRKPKPMLPSGEGMPLNKYLAHCGISSRRKAVEFIENGEVTVNGEVKLEPYYRIAPGDAVVCQGNPVTIQERMVYVLLNKPKNVITTTDDERGRATVIDIVDSSFPERLYPVGRLDRDTTGLILLTNDGDLAQKLSHPSHQVMKQYRIGLDKPLTHADEKLIEAGLELEDGLMEVNWLRFSEDHPDRDVVEVEISSGRNRIIRRLFEALGYDVRKLDRFYFAGLTKKELPRGSFRELTQREIVMLKHFTGHPSTAKKRAEDGEEDATEIEPEIPAIEPTDDKPVE